MSWIKVSVFDEDGNWLKWWENFYDYCKSVGYDFEREEDITLALRENGAYNIPDSDYIRFRSEKYMTAFLLRWS